MIGVGSPAAARASTSAACPGRRCSARTISRPCSPDSARSRPSRSVSSASAATAFIPEPANTIVSPMPVNTMPMFSTDE